MKEEFEGQETLDFDEVDVSSDSILDDLKFFEPDQNSESDNDLSYQDLVDKSEVIDLNRLDEVDEANFKTEKFHFDSSIDLEVTQSGEVEGGSNLLDDLLGAIPGDKAEQIRKILEQSEEESKVVEQLEEDKDIAEETISDKVEDEVVVPD